MQASAWSGRRAAAAAGWRCPPAGTLILRARASRDSRAEGFLASRWVRMAQPETVWDKNVLY
ncbi:MAG: hypothetical protein ACXVCF_20605, partial [Isosphaeraceae bacterium]